MNEEQLAAQLIGVGAEKVLPNVARLGEKAVRVILTWTGFGIRAVLANNKQDKPITGRQSVKALYETGNDLHSLNMSRETAMNMSRVLDEMGVAYAISEINGGYGVVIQGKDASLVESAVNHLSNNMNFKPGQIIKHEDLTVEADRQRAAEKGSTSYTLHQEIYDEEWLAKHSNEPVIPDPQPVWKVAAPPETVKPDIAQTQQNLQEQQQKQPQSTEIQSEKAADKQPEKTVQKEKTVPAENRSGKKKNYGEYTPPLSIKQLKGATENVEQRYLQAWTKGDVQEMRNMLDFDAKFVGKYSYQNVNAIRMQNMKATDTRGYSSWRASGRQVMKGQKGIRILAPIVKKIDQIKDLSEIRSRDKKDGTAVVGYKTITVFDVAQTQGEPLKVQNMRVSAEKSLSEMLQKHGISGPVNTENLNKLSQSMLNGRAYPLHNAAVAHIVAKHYGLPIDNSVFEKAVASREGAALISEVHSSAKSIVQEADERTLKRDGIKQDSSRTANKDGKTKIADKQVEKAAATTSKRSRR